MTASKLQHLQGRQVSVALQGGKRIDDCQLVSAGRVGTATLWLFSNGTDVFVPVHDVLDVWESPIAQAA